MLIYKQRYKPRTTREFTKSDLTVYDSAGNTALNAITVYGKSEVVDGAIVSAGEGWATVDLGTFLWYKDDNYNAFFSPSLNDIIKTGFTNSTPAPMMCGKYVTTAFFTAEKGHFEGKDKAIAYAYKSGERLYVKDTAYTDATAFKNSLIGVILAYQLADPTQGNAIAIKTDNGSGIDGTMATFSTGTPLRGITGGARNIMQWDGSAGTVTKICGEADLGTYNWNYSTEYFSFTTRITDMAAGTYDIAGNILCANYQTKSQAVLDTESTGIAVANNNNVVIIKDPNYTDPAAFKTAMNGVKLVYELATPTTEQLTSTENASIAGLRTFQPQTHAQNNAQTDMTVDYTIKVPTI